MREAESEVETARQELGPQGNDNPQFREALAAAEQAKLDLVRTTVLAPSDGVITNLQLTDGEFVAAGEAALTFIDTRDVWINANFRENSLEKVKPGDPVELVLDTLPGRVFAAKVQSVGWGVSQGSIDPDTGCRRSMSRWDWFAIHNASPLRSNPTGKTMSRAARLWLSGQRDCLCNRQCRRECHWSVLDKARSYPDLCQLTPPPNPVQADDAHECHARPQLCCHHGGRLYFRCLVTAHALGHLAQHIARLVCAFLS